MSLCQRKYCLDLLKETSLMEAKSTIMDPTHNLYSDPKKFIIDSRQFRQLIGKLIYYKPTITHF